MKSWRSTLGGAFSALGVSLMGIGIVPDRTSDNYDTLHWLSIAGFVFTGVGSFFGHLFAADKAEVNAISERVDANTRAAITGDTSRLKKPIEKP